MKVSAVVCLAAAGTCATALHAPLAVLSVRESAIEQSAPTHVLKRQEISQCNDVCATDAAAVAGLESCSNTDILCLCTYLAHITANCLACVVYSDDLTMGELQSGCAAATMSAPVDSVTITGGSETSTPAGTASSPASSSVTTEVPSVTSTHANSGSASATSYFPSTNTSIASPITSVSSSGSARTSTSTNGSTISSPSTTSGSSILNAPSGWLLSIFLVLALHVGHNGSWVTSDRGLHVTSSKDED